ncbi:MAG TPA: radical SAM protein, partial [Actinomycetota bacterium]|nr:radical SAM protein [Actinomycetota bacterium]
VEACLEAGATHVSPILLHLRPGVREEFLPWLEEHHPDLVPRYLEMYRHPYGPKADRDTLGRMVGRLVREAGGTPRSGMSSERHRHRGLPGPNVRPKEAKQLKLL